MTCTRLVPACAALSTSSQCVSMSSPESFDLRHQLIADSTSFFLIFFAVNVQHYNILCRHVIHFRCSWGRQGSNVAKESCLPTFSNRARCYPTNLLHHKAWRVVVIFCETFMQKNSSSIFTIMTAFLQYCVTPVCIWHHTTVYVSCYHAWCVHNVGAS